jgi:hypothetical protein
MPDCLRNGRGGAARSRRSAATSWTLIFAVFTRVSATCGSFAELRATRQRCMPTLTTSVATAARIPRFAPVTTATFAINPSSKCPEMRFQEKPPLDRAGGKSVPVLGGATLQKFLSKVLWRY